MMVYVINEMVDDEYGCREAQAVYATLEDAEQWVAEHQEMIEVWFSSEPLPLYTIAEFHLQ